MALTMVASSLLFLAFLLQGSAYGDVCAGCPVEFDAKEDGSDKMVYQALQTINSNSANSLEILRIVRATRQVVNGIKYSFDVEYSVNGVKSAETCKIEILSQPWTKEEPHVIAQNCAEVKNELRQARQLLGGLRDVDESEMDMVKDLADFAVSTLDEIDTDNNKQIVNEIVEAKKQLVNGIMYHLTLRVKTTSCKEGSVSDPSDPCNDSQTGPAKLCKIQLHRSWADKSPLNAKVVKSECEEETRMAMGGLRPVDVNDDSLNSITDFALEHINSMSNSMFMSGLVGLEKANYQVVAGMKYFLTMKIADTDCLKNSYQKGAKCNFVSNPSGKATCDIAVWVKPWENFMQVTSAKCNDKTFDGSRNEKRSALMAGAPSEIDPNTQSVKELTEFSLKEMDKETNSIYRLAASRVIRVTSQVVAGTKYTITMEVGESNCQKGVPTNSECTPNGETKTCSVEIWDRPWLNDRRVIKSTCNNIRRTRQVGGHRPVGPDSEEVRSQLGFVSNHVNQNVNSANYLTITRVISATSQVVAGTSTRITFGVSETNCDKRVPADLSRCQVAANSPERVCTITIWDQPWLNKKTVTDFSCGGTNV